MDILENNVRSECKQAFAELQTDLTDLTMELETTGIPIVPHRSYVMNVFFPGVSEHPVLLQQIPEWQNGCGAQDSMFGFSMAQFEQLILNKTFLLTLVDTVGYGDQINKEDSFKSIVDYIDSQFEAWLQEELKIKRNLSAYHDSRVHVCLYFITPHVLSKIFYTDVGAVIDR